MVEFELIIRFRFIALILVVFLVSPEPKKWDLHFSLCVIKTLKTRFVKFEC